MAEQVELDLFQQNLKRISEEKAEAEKLAAQEAEKAKVETERLEQEKLKAENQNAEAQKLEAERLEKERLEAERLAAEAAKGEEEKTNTFFEKLDSLGKQTEQKPETKLELSDDVKKKLEEYEAVRNQLETYKNNPLVKALELGKDIKEIAKQIVGKDTSTLSFEQLVEAKMKKDFNLEGDDLKEAVADELSRLEGRSRFENARLEKELRAEFSESADVGEIAKQLQEYENELKSKMPYQPTEQEMIAQMEKVKNEDFQSIDTVASALLDADIEGVKFTKEFVEDVKKNYNINELAPYIDPKTNELNSKQLLYDKFILANWQKIAEAKAEKAVKAAMKDVANPDKNRGKSPSAETVDVFKTLQEQWGMNTKQRVINID